MIYLALVDSLERVDVALGACLDFGKDNDTVAPRDDVYLESTHSPVTLYHRKAVGYELVGGKLLAPFAKIVVFCHVCHYLRQKAGVRSTSTVNISRRPVSIISESIHLAVSGKMS